MSSEPILSLPSSNRALYNAKFSWIPQAKDTPALPFKRRSQSLTMGGLSVATALVPQAGRFTSSINFDDHGNRFGQIKWSASNDFEFCLFNAGSFQNVRPINALVNGYANDGGFNQRFGGKAVFMHQLRGAPFTTSGSISLGRNYDTSSFQGYLFTEAIGTWEANESLAINFNPKLAWSGISSPFGVGISANIGLSSYLQLIPEINATLHSIKASNATLALRWLASSSSALDIYISDAAGLYDIGQLLKSDSYRVGFKFTVQL